MSRPPRRRTPPQLCPEPPRIRSHTPPPKRASGQRSPERRARSPGPMRVKRPIRNNTPPHRSRSPLERRPSKSGPPPREFAPPARTERELHSSPRPRAKRDFRGAGPADTPVASRSRHSRSRSPVAAERSSKDRPFPAKRPSSGPLETTVVTAYSGPDRNKFKSEADFQGEEEDELERPIFRGPDSGKTGYNLSELKSIQVKILRKIKSDGTVDNVNRTVPNLEEITPVRRHDSSVGGAGAKHFPPSQNRNGRGINTDIWDEDPLRSYFHQPKDWAEFKNEGNRPIFERFANQKVEKPPEHRQMVYRRSHSPTGRDNSKSDGPSRIDSNTDRYPVNRYPAERDRDRERSDREREKERDRESRVPFEPQKYHEPLDPHEKRSFSYGRSGGDDLRQAIERRRDDSRYPQPDFRESHEKSRPVPESNVRGRINERFTDHNLKHDSRERNRERPRERERERADYQPPRKPLQDRRRASPGASSRRPSDRDPDFDRERHRGDKEQWERERGREVDVDRRRPPKSRDRDEERRETRPPREARPPRRPDDRSADHRGSYRNTDYPQDEEEEEEEEYEAAPVVHHSTRGGRGRGGGWGGPHPPGRGGGMFRGAMRGPVMRPPVPPYQPFFPPPVRPMPMIPIRGYPPHSQNDTKELELAIPTTPIALQ
ncbi:hypothetical protein LSTR_LSTR005319 [Laodelphax striatellus]|uniref:Uncharacterized protein n=1 Tax=Laodelphax striatellus TaxID=195883 RepID=A0A482X820_LAOST|nr:hypothetical protein LSTR_LSTR005319 [Laodelphax striatellus]